MILVSSGVVVFLNLSLDLGLGVSACAFFGFNLAIGLLGSSWSSDSSRLNSSVDEVMSENVPSSF
jgi:hypothetical protein